MFDVSFPCLYLHVPFSCGPSLRDGYAVSWSDEMAEHYVVAAMAECAMEGRVHPEIVYWGGGDPSVLDPALTARLCSAVRNLSDRPPVEWTVEIERPEGVTSSWLDTLSEHGVNRLNVTLASPEDLPAALHVLRAWKERGAGHVAFDLLLPRDEAGRAAWSSFVEQVIDARPDHVSMYEHGESIGEDVVPVMERADAAMTGAGYEQYEIWSYAFDGATCRYLEHCWRGRDYLGIGPSAASHRRGHRWTNRADVEAYTEAIACGKRPERDIEAPDAMVLFTDLCLIGLQLSEGIDPSALLRQVAETFPNVGENTQEFSNPWKKMQKNFQSLENRGLITESGPRWRLTPSGRFRADEVGRAILESGSGPGDAEEIE